MRHRSLAPWCTRLGAALVIVVSGSFALLASPASASPSPFDAPSSMALVGPYLFVTNYANSTVTEVDAGTGAFLATIPAATLRAANPTAIVADDNELFVAAQGGSISEISGNGQYLGQLVVTGCGSATALVVENTSTVVELCSNGRLNEIDTADLTLGSTIRASVIKATERTFTKATALAIEGTSAYVTFTTTNNASDGVVVYSLVTNTITSKADEATNPGDAFAAPAGIAVAGKFLWITNAGTDAGTTVTTGISPSVEQLARATLSFIISDSSSNDLGTAGAVLANHASGTSDTDVYVATIQGTTAPMVSYYDPPTVQPSSPTLNWKWMMCNTNASPPTPGYPYKFDHPSAFALYGPILWVANAATDLNNSPRTYGTHVEAMNAETGAYLFNAS